MAAGYVPNPGDIAARGLAQAHFGERERDTGEDHCAHAAGAICESCGQAIEAEQPARRRGDSGWVHDVCPPVTE